MAHDILKEFRERVSHLENSGYPHGQSKELAEYCLRTANDLALKLPEWLAGAENRRFEDVEEMMSALPQVLCEWYNNIHIPVYILTPDVVLTHNSRQTLEGQVTENMLADIIYVKADGSIKEKDHFDAALILSPQRLQSLQLAEISKRLTVGSYVLLLDPDGTEDLPGAIRKNDKNQLEFLLARWEIEREEGAKRLRYQELVAQFQAMIGGDPA